MPAISAHNLKMMFGDRTLFENADFEIDEKVRVGLVGANGTGKTTLFRLITGELEPVEGVITKSRHLVLGYMKQHVSAGSQTEVYDDALSVFAPIMAIERELEEIADKIHSGNGDLKALIDRQHFLQEEFERKEGLTYRSRTSSALLGLGFSEDDFNLTCAQLSGGQLSKLSLAKLLLSKPDLLLLDEPTNHLDIESVEWLEDFLRDFHGAAVIISHDRYFLDRVTEKTLTIENQRIELWPGNYTAHLHLKRERDEITRRHYANQMKEIHRIEGIIEQQRRWNRERNIIAAESKQKMLDKKIARLVEPDKETETMRFEFKAAKLSGKEVLSVEGLSKSYGGNPLFTDASFSLRRGERVFLLGPNGCGKTTLLRIINGQTSADAGVFTLGANVQTGFFDQNLADLSLENTLLDEIWDENKHLTATRVRNALAAFLFKGDEVEKKIKSLSGGERARAALLKLMLTGANFLILDEPTNHLDINSREVLEEALLSFDGTMLVVSHDRYFINKLAARVLYMTSDGMQSYAGNYDDYIEKVRKPAAEEKTAPVKPKSDYRQRKERESEQRRLKGQIRRCEEKIEELEKESAAMQQTLERPEVAADYEKVLELTQKMDSLRLEQEKLLEEWEDLHSRLEEFDGE